MPSTSNPKVLPIQAFQAARIDLRVNEIVGRLQEQHSRIEDMVSRLLRCLAAIQLTEQAVGAGSSLGPIGEMRRSLAEAQVVLENISETLDRLAIRAP